MENTFIYLDSCDTCQRILKTLNLPETIKRQNVKSQPITLEQLSFLAEQAGNYEALFNRRAQLYRARGLHKKQLTEIDYKELLLDHYTFIKRPVFIFNNTAYVGNNKKTVALAAASLVS
jgi:arsenate reductase-like glutaredoxin family protein